jgi:hypothetical protein
MSNAPHFDIDVAAFWADPYPDFAKMRREAPIAFVPQLGSCGSTTPSRCGSAAGRFAGC